MSSHGCQLISSSSKVQLAKLDKCFLLNTLRNLFQPSGMGRNLGIWFDSGFAFSKQALCKSSFAPGLRRLEHYFTQDTLITAANALVGSHLDYCNSLF